MRILELIGVSVLAAHGEADAVIALLSRLHTVDAGASNDIDSLVFGAERVVRQLTFRDGADCALVEVLEQSTLLQQAGVTEQQLVQIASIVKNDYNVDNVVGFKEAKRIIESGEVPPVCPTTVRALSKLFNVARNASSLSQLCTIATPKVLTRTQPPLHTARM